MAQRVLIVEDEPDIRDLLVFHLEREGYQVVKCRNGVEALRAAHASPPDLVLLDLMLPEMDGLEVCRRLRQDPATQGLPIVMLTARGDEVDRVLGLEMGADDYVVKPFSPRELIARIRAVLRRARPAAGTAALTVGRITIDPAAHIVLVDGAPVSLTRKEFDLLRALVEARGRVLSREFLLDHVWGYTAAGEVESRTVDVHVRRLRQKLGPEGQRISTVTGVGYRLEQEA
jgi:phosphate regulon transcriptional regulator PhoB